MTLAALRLLGRLLLGSAVSALAWWYGGITAFCTSLALFGVLLARPLLDFASDLRQALRSAVWAPLAGRHWVYRGTPVEVLLDDRHGRWLRASDLRRIAGTTASDGALALSYPGGCRRIGRPPQCHLRDDAVLLHLAKERSPEALRFARWVEREIAFPARRLRTHHGIRLEPAQGPPPQA